MIILDPIGFVCSSDNYRHKDDKDKEYYLEIKKKFRPALKELKNYKYLFVIFYMHQVKKQGNLQLEKKEGKIGVFASRSPQRPNPLGLSVVKLIRVEDNLIHVSGLDAFPGSPVLDIKPYIKGIDNREDADSGWDTEVSLDKDRVYLYTDGACSGNPGPGGYAALIIRGNSTKEVTGYQPETTNNRMELMAVIEGLKKIDKGSAVKLISDSTYVLKGLKEWLNNWKMRGWKTAGNKPVKNRDLWIRLDELIKDYNIEFVKVKGHSGDQYNEFVDTLAREQIP
ncbi:MAG TPA: ribonuclease HI [Halanaerobiales bacterium]|nr:ribonuclease HI [Halanaerobiales bacterium]